MNRTLQHNSRINDADALIQIALLIGLGLSILILNRWDHVAVRTALGISWGVSMLLLNAPELVRVIKQSERYRRN
ncbi:MAG: hypothetical protein WBP93_05845 [Pyrinomonadaceae bacterium]